MAKRVISIEISRTLMKICEVDYKSKNPEIHQAFTIPTPDGAFDDGFITETDKFSMYLKDALMQHNIKTKTVIFSISSSRIANREVFIPLVKEKQVAQVVKANASDYFPVDISGYQLAHSILNTVEQDGQPQYKLLVLAAPKPMLESYFILARKANLVIDGIDYSGNSIIPIIKHAITGEPTMIIKMDEHQTLITVMKDRAVALQRSINTGAQIAINTVMELDAFGVDTTFDKAVEMLRDRKLIRRSFDGATPDESDDRNDSALFHQAKVELTDALRGLISSIVRVVDYYNSRNSEATIDRFILTGFGADFNGFAKLLSHEIGQNVVVLSHVDGVSLDRNMMTQRISFGDYISCIGATFNPVGLMPEEFKKGKTSDRAGSGKSGSGSLMTMNLSDMKIDQVCVVLCIIGCIAAVGLGGYAYYRHFQADLENKQLQARVTQLEPIELVVNDYNNAKTLYSDAVAMYDLTQNNNENIVAFIEELEEKMPSSIALEALSSTSDTVALTMMVDSEEAIGKVVENLRTFESLSGLEFTGSSKTVNDAGQATWEVTVLGYYNAMPSLAADELAEGEEATNDEEKKAE